MTIQEIYKSALEAEKETGVPALFVVAQAILESGWHITPIKNSNNIFGIKFYNERWGYVEAPTIEYIGGKPHNVIAKFQKFPTLKDCIIAHSELLTKNIKGRYAKYTYKQCLERYKKGKDLKAYVQCVAKSYATDPDYAKKIMNIIESIKDTLEVMTMDDEFKEARELMKKMGIFRPYGEESVYWTTHPTREEIAVILTRFLDSLRIEVIGEGKAKTYTTGGENNV
ncbi:MAG: glucosaminidase domain-containing protein [Caldisericaceae bacterium]|nr:glucosaminidase domain-containing protein [Caldisericaceae bacterium]